MHHHCKTCNWALLWNSSIISYHNKILFSGQVLWNSNIKAFIVKKWITPPEHIKLKCPHLHIKKLKKILIFFFIFYIIYTGWYTAWYSILHMLYLDEIPLDHVRTRQMFVWVLHTECKQPLTFTWNCSLLYRVFQKDLNYKNMFPWGTPHYHW